jgi:hypothetical protein
VCRWNDSNNGYYLKKNLIDLKDVRGFLSRSRSQYLLYGQKKARPTDTSGFGKLSKIREQKQNVIFASGEYKASSPK